MPVTRDEVIWAFRFILGRDPQSEKTIFAHQQARDQKTLRSNLMASSEYRELAPTVIDFAYEKRADYHRQAIVFLHVPKCAGTTFHNILLGGLQLPFCPERHNGIGNWPAGLLARYSLFSGHFDAASLDLIPARTLNLVTCLREPAARLVSAYRFLRAHSSGQRHNMGLVQLANALDPVAFFSHAALARHPSINNGMVRQLSGHLPQKRWEAFYPSRVYPPALADINPSAALREACALLDRMLAFGILEHMDESLSYISKELGISVPPEVRRLNALDTAVQANDLLKHVPVIEMSKELEIALSPHVELDIQLYDFALSTLKTRGVVNC